MFSQALTRMCCATFVAAFATLLLIANRATAKTDFPMQGGPGDAGFSNRCPANQYLTGLAGRAGNVIDRIAIICSPILPNETQGPKYYGPPRGGAGGTEQEFSCATGSFVTGVRYAMVLPHERMYEVDLLCHSQAVAQSIVYFKAANDYYSRNVIASGQVCPNAELATGFSGRYGTNVNALGLYCDARVVTTGAPVRASVHRVYPIRTTGKVASTPAPDSLVAKVCPSGFVWREASTSDHVCVTPLQRTRTANENAAGPGHINMTDRTNGAYTCVRGYVWREAFAGDDVCVTPRQRRAAAAENERATRQ